MTMFDSTISMKYVNRGGTLRARIVKQRLAAKYNKEFPL
jgi:hypothetical protein